MEKVRAEQARKRRDAEDRAADAEMERIRLGDGYDLMDGDY